MQIFHKCIIEMRLHKQARPFAQTLWENLICLEAVARYNDSHMQVLSDATISSGRSVSAQQCAQEILDGLPEVMWTLRRHMRKRRAKGLSVPQFRSLCLIKQTPEGSLSAVSEGLGSTLPTASRIVAGLVTRGLVSRKSCSDDRRQVSLQLTPKGSSILDVAREGTQKAFAEKLVKLSPEERGAISSSLALLVQTLGRLSCESNNMKSAG